MKLSEMETALKRYGFDTEDPLKTWLNGAMHDLEAEMDWPWLESNVLKQKMPVGSSTITLPATASKVLMIRDATNLKKLVYFDRHRFLRDIMDPTEKGLAEVYTLISTNEVQIFRTLEKETEFEVLYQGTTPDLALAADEPTTEGNVWPLVTHYPIVIRAASIALQAENEEERSKNAQMEYDKILARLRGKFGQRELDEPLTVQDVQEYGQGDELSRYVI